MENMYTPGDLADKKTLLKSMLDLQRSNEYTNEQMADFIGCSRQTYGKVRTGELQASDAFLWRVLQFLIANSGRKDEKGVRIANINRETAETNIDIALNIDGSGKYEINTGIGIFDHMLAQFARHGAFDIKIKAAGDDPHHLIEDVAICMGQALGQALGDKRGIVRMANANVPMDEVLATVTLDISGRGYAVTDFTFSGNDMPGFPADMLRHFLESFAIAAKLNLHARILYGNNDHHKAEALFKALGRAMDTATRLDERIYGELPSTKEYLEV